MSSVSRGGGVFGKETLSQAKLSTWLVISHTSNSLHWKCIYLDEDTGNITRNLLVKYK